MTATTTVTATVGTRGLWKRRLLVVLGAVVAAVVVYLITNAAVSGTLKTPAMGSQASRSLSVGFVIFVPALVSLLAWGLLMVLERVTSKGGLIWRIVATVVLVLSLGAPFSGTGITGANRFSLALMHVVVGAILIVFLPSGRRKAAQSEQRDIQAVQLSV